MTTPEKIRIDQLDPATLADLETDDFLIPLRRGAKEVKLTPAEFAQVIIRAAAFGALASKDTAADVPYVPGEGPLTAETVQAVIDELEALLVALGLAVDGKQPLAANLTALAGLTGAADKLPFFSGAGVLALANLTSSGRALIEMVGSADRLPYFTGQGATALATFTSQARELLDDTTFAAMRATLEIPLAKSYVSAPQTITSTGPLTLAHGLGAEPALVLCELICVNSSGGYAPGQVVPIFAPGGNTASGGGANNINFTLVKSSTAIFVRYGPGVQVFQLPDLAAGTTVNLANSDWNFRVRAWA